MTILNSGVSMIRRSAAGLVATVLVAMVTTATVGSHAVPLQQESPRNGEVLSSVKDFYLADYDVTEEQADRALAQMPGAARFLGRLTSAAGKHLARARLIHEPLLSIRVSITREGDLDELRALADTAPVPVDIRVVETPSLDSLNAVAQRFASIWRERYEDLGTIALDGEVGEIQVEALHVNEARAREISEEIAREYDLAGAAVVVKPSANELPENYRRAGFNMEGEGTLGGCTLGFSVRPISATGSWGSLSAAHCSQVQRWFNFNVGATLEPMSLQDGLLDGARDMNWYKLDVTPQGYYYGTSKTTALPIQGRLDRTELDGTYNCHRGRRTGFSCGEVVSISSGPAGMCEPYACAFVWPLVEGENLGCWYGDSGGPHLYANLATGIHKGGSSSGGDLGDCNWLIFTPVGQMVDMGMKLMLAQ